MHMFVGHSWGTGFLGMIVMVLFWVLIVAGALYLLKLLLTLGSPKNQRGDSPEEILKRRYARGEIDKEEYHQLLRDLRG